MDDTFGLKLREKWSTGGCTMGPFVQMPAPGSVEIFASAGFDLVHVDFEHGAFGPEVAEEMMRAARSGGIVPVARLATNQNYLITQALNFGAGGVLVPHVSSFEAALEAVRSTKFSGTRGVCPFVRAAGYSALKETDYYERADASVVAGVMIEGRSGLDALDRMLEIEDLDLVYLAPYDLSASLGVTGEVRHPVVLEAIESACERAAAAGKVIGTFAESAEEAALWIERGVRYLGVDVDSQILYRASKAICDGVAQRLSSAPAAN